MIQFRTGPHMGIPYQEARALGLSSALKGPEFYAQYVAMVQVTTPSERLMRSVMPDYKANRSCPTVTLRKEIMVAMERVATWHCQTDFIVGLLKGVRDSMDAQPVPVPNEWRLPIPFDVLKPARKEKPE